MAACRGGEAPPQARTSTEATSSGPPPTVLIQRTTPTPTPVPTPPPPQVCAITRERGVPLDYVPQDLVFLPAEVTAPRQPVQMRKEAAEAFVELVKAGRAEDQLFVGTSGYRSADEQRIALESERRAYGAEVANKQVAEPGHSEHQLGIAIDMGTARAPNALGIEFASTPEGQWVFQNAHRFGFVISYPEGKEHVTGYIYEPWHWRYVGVGLAAEIRASGKTTQEFLHAKGMDGCPPNAP